MKVRMRNTDGPEYEVLEESALYYIVRGGLPDRDVYERLAVRKDYCAPVPDEPTWVDITYNCDLVNLNGDILFQHRPGKHECNTLFEIPRLMELEGYRIRKVKSLKDNFVQTAFIVEKRT